MSNTRTVYHRNHTVTIWSVLEQRWMRRVSTVSAAELACCSHEESDRIRLHLGI